MTLLDRLDSRYQRHKAVLWSIENIFGFVLGFFYFLSWPISQICSLIDKSINFKTILWQELKVISIWKCDCSTTDDLNCINVECYEDCIIISLYQTNMRSSCINFSSVCNCFSKSARFLWVLQFDFFQSTEFITELLLRFGMQRCQHFTNLILIPGSPSSNTAGRDALILKFCWTPIPKTASNKNEKLQFPVFVRDNS